MCGNKAACVAARICAVPCRSVRSVRLNQNRSACRTVPLASEEKRKVVLLTFTRWQQRGGSWRDEDDRRQLWPGGAVT